MKNKFFDIVSKYCGKIIDWLMTGLMILVFLLSFFIKEHNSVNLYNISFKVLGILGIAYLIMLLFRFFFQKIKFDHTLVKGRFLHKVINTTLIIPFVLTYVFIICEIKSVMDGNAVKAESEIHNDSIENKPNAKLCLLRSYNNLYDSLDMTSLQLPLAKKLAFSENLYNKAEDKLLIKDTSQFYKIESFAKLVDWKIEFDSTANEYYFLRTVDELPENIIDDKNEEPSLFWSVYYHYIDPGNQHIASTEKGRKWAAAIAILGYFFLNGLLVAVLIGWFDRRRDEWQKGDVRYNSFFKRKKHYVIIGGNDMVSGIVKQLFEKKGNRHSYVLIQTSKDVEKLRRELYSELTDQQQRYVVLYYGNRTSKTDVEDLKLNTAECVYIVGESIADDGQNHDAFNMDCLRLVTDYLKPGCDRKDVYVIFENQITFSSFQFSDISMKDKEKINYMPLNYYEMWSQRIFAFSDPTGIIKHKDCEENKQREYYPLDAVVKDGKVSYITRESSDYVHLVIVGMSKMGVTMGLEAAHIAHYPNALTSKGPRTRITFIDENADRESGYLMNRYSDLFALSRWRYADAGKYNNRKSGEEYLYSDFNATDATWHDPLNDDKSISPYKDVKLGVDGDKAGDEFFIDIEWEFIKGGLSDFSVQQYLKECADKKSHPDKILTVAICLEEPHQAIAGGLYLPDMVYENALQILVYQRSSDSILKYIAESAASEDDGKNVRYKNVKPFGMLNETFDSMCADDYLPKLVNYVYNIEYKIKREDGSYDWSVFENYNEQVAADVIATWKKSVMKFDNGKSGCAVRWSNIYNANSIRTKLRSVGWNSGVLKKDVIETMAITEHNRWNVEQLLMHYVPLGKEEQEELENLNKTDRDKHKARKTELKRKMRHVDICSYGRLKDVDAGVEKYDKALSEALPYLVDIYKLFKKN